MNKCNTRLTELKVNTHIDQRYRQKISHWGGGKRQNINGGRVTGNIFRELFFVGISLF